MRTLHLTLKKKWFDMIASGEKKEEYREVKPYWIKRLTKIDFVREGTPNTIKLLCHKESFNEFDVVVFKNGYSKNAPILTVECKGVHYGYPAKFEWIDSCENNWYFCIELGQILPN